MPPLVKELIEDARIRHWAFTEVELGDGAALRFLNARQRAHLASSGALVEGLVNTSLQYATQITPNGALVGLIDGVPTFLSTFDDGYAVHFDDDGVPYINSEDEPIAGDPFGANGGVPGFPLPADFVRLTNVSAVYSNNRVVPIDVVLERDRHSQLPGRNASAFISGNRLVPILPFSTGNTGDRWFGMSAIQVSYVAIQLLSSLSDVVMLPTLLCEALTADLAAMMAGQCKECTPADRAFAVAEAQRCARAVADAANDMLDSVQQSNIIFRP